MSTMVETDVMNPHNSRDTAAVTTDLKTHLSIFLPIGILALIMFVVFPISIVCYRRYQQRIKDAKMNIPLMNVKIDTLKNGRIMATAAMGYMQAINPDSDDTSLNTQQRDVMERMTSGAPKMDITNTSQRRHSFSMSTNHPSVSTRSTRSDMNDDNDELFGDSDVLRLDIRPVSQGTW